MKTFEGALQGNETLLNVHSKRKRARWRMIASRDDTPVWPRGATLNATSPPPPRDSTMAHTRTQPPFAGYLFVQTVPPPTHTFSNLNSPSPTMSCYQRTLNSVKLPLVQKCHVTNVHCQMAFQMFRFSKKNN